MSDGPTPTSTPTKVLVCTDFSAAAGAGEREAARRFPDATLVLFYAVDPLAVRRILAMTTLDGAKLKHDMMQYADERLSEVIDRLHSQGHKALPELVEGDPVEAALAAAARHEASMIVVGAASRVEVGTFRTRLLRRTRVPVLVIPSDE